MNIPKRNEAGFTLVELMIVVAIIGILAAIAVPQFMAYRTRSYNASAKALVHNMVGTQSDLNSELGSYGNTEAAGALLNALVVGAGTADVTADNTLALPATVATVGGRMSGTNPTTLKQFAVAIGYGPNMIAQANASAAAASAICYARHFRGDTAYAIDNEATTQVYSVSNAAWRSVVGLGLGATPILVVVDEINDFAGAPPGGGAPDGPWRAVE